MNQTLLQHGKGAMLALVLTASAALAAAPKPAPAKPGAAKKPVAVSALKSRGVSSDVAELLTDVLRSELGATNAFQVMNREDMSSVMQEVKLAAAGACSGKNRLVDAYRALGVAKMIGGSIGKLGSKYVLTVKLVDLNTTKNELQFTETYAGPVEGLDKVMKTLALKLAGKRSAPAKTTLRAKYPPEGMVLVPADSKILSADGRVMILASEGDSKGRTLKAGAVVPAGAVIATAPKARARVQLPNGSLLDLKPQTKVALKTAEASADGEVSWTRVKVVTGGLLARVKKLTSRKSGFEIQSGEAVCGVRGTIVGAGSEGDFQNYTGEVEVDEDGDSMEVPPGYEYDDGDINLIGDEDYSGWGDLTGSGVNPGESADTPTSDTGSSDQGGGEASGASSTSSEGSGSQAPSEGGEPASEESPGATEDSGEDLLDVGDTVQDDIGNEVLDEFETIQNGTIELNITFVEQSSGG